MCLFKRFKKVAGNKTLGQITKEDRSVYNNQCGVYKMKDKNTGETKYIGRAIEHNNGGFRKRLSDYTRPSGSARKHSSGKAIYENRDNLNVEFYSTGKGTKGAQKAARLEKKIIEKEKKRSSNLYNVQWNRDKE